MERETLELEPGLRGLNLAPRGVESTEYVMAHEGDHVCKLYIQGTTFSPGEAHPHVFPFKSKYPM